MIATAWAYGFAVGTILGGSCGVVVAGLLFAAARDRR